MADDRHSVCFIPLGFVGPATPVLYTNSDLSNLSVVVLFYGNGVIADVLDRARTPSSTVTRVADAVDWRNLETSFYVGWFTSPKPGAHDLLGSVLRSVLPWSEPFFFSCIPAAYSPLIAALALERGATLEWNHASEWRAEAEQIVRSHHDAEVRAIDEVRASAADSIAPTNSVASPASATSTSSDDSQSPSSAPSALSSSPPAAALAPHITIEPLRLEHVDLVVANW
jgi:hypothetical protein